VISIEHKYTNIRDSVPLPYLLLGKNTSKMPSTRLNTRDDEMRFGREREESPSWHTKTQIPTKASKKINLP